MWIVSDAFFARSRGLQLRVPVAIAHPVGTGAVIVQSTPLGSGSFNATALATPSPELVTTIVKPMGSPADTDAASATFVMPRLGQSTVTLSLSELLLALVSPPATVIVTVFGKRPQFAGAVTALITTTLVSSGARLNGPQVSDAPTVQP